MWFDVSGWFGGSGLLFCVCFFEMEKDPVGGVFFTFVGVFSWIFGAWRSLLVRFWCPWVVFGRVWCRGGVREPTLSIYVDLCFSIGSLLASFWCHFWSKTVLILRCFLRCVC